MSLSSRRVRLFILAFVSGLVAVIYIFIPQTKTEIPMVSLPLSEAATEAQLNLAHDYFNAGNYAQTTSLYEDIIARNGGSAKLYQELAHYYRYWYKFPESEINFKKAIELEPDNHRIWTDLGKLYRNMGEYEKAEEVLERSVELEPNDPETYSFGFGYLYLEQKRFADAKAAFAHSLELDPNYELGLTGLGDVFSREGDHETAVTYYKQALAIDPLSEALYSLGMAYRELGRYQESLDTLQFYLDNKNERAEVYYQMGATYERMGNREAAYAAFRRAYDLNPDRDIFRAVLDSYPEFQ